MKSIESKLKIETITVVESELRTNNKVSQKDYKGEIPINISPNFLANKDNKNIGRIYIQAELFNENFIELLQPYYLRAVIMGEFSCGESYDVFDDYVINMTSMLLPYLRSFIAGYNGLSGLMSVHIPAINVLELFEHISSDSEEDVQ